MLLLHIESRHFDGLAGMTAQHRRQSLKIDRSRKSVGDFATNQAPGVFGVVDQGNHRNFAAHPRQPPDGAQKTAHRQLRQCGINQNRIEIVFAYGIFSRPTTGNIDYLMPRFAQ